MIRESIEEIEREDKIREIPIPQMEAVDIGSLFSKEEKDLFRIKRYVNEQARTKEETPSEPEEKRLEEFIHEEQESIKNKVDYAKESQQAYTPMNEIYETMARLYNTSEWGAPEKKEFAEAQYHLQKKAEQFHQAEFQTSKYVEAQLTVSQKMAEHMQERYRT